MTEEMFEQAKTETSGEVESKKVEDLIEKSKKGG